MTKHMVTGLITGVNHFQSLIDKPIKLEISLKSSWRSSQLEYQTESARIEAYVSLYTPLLPLNRKANLQLFKGVLCLVIVLLCITLCHFKFCINLDEIDR